MCKLLSIRSRGQVLKLESLMPRLFKIHYMPQINAIDDRLSIVVRAQLEPP